jgi:hypothetical protein
VERFRSPEMLCRSARARLAPASVRVAQLRLVESTDPQHELELVAQMRALISGPSVAIVNCTRTRRRRGTCRALLARERFREQVRGRAKLEHDPGLADLAHQPPVVGGEDPVPDDARRHYL